MFESFNFSEFAVIMAVYMTLLIASQVFLPKMIGWFMNKAASRLYTTISIGIVAVVAWPVAIVMFGWEAAAVLAIGAVLEIAVTYFRRQAIVNAVMKALEDNTTPLNFNDINGKAL